MQTTLLNETLLIICIALTITMSVKSAIESHQSEGNTAWNEHPENPQNWTRAKKTVNLGIVSLLAFITYKKLIS